MPDEFKYDVFISYRRTEPDQTWVRRELRPALEAAGLAVCIDVEDFVPGRDLIREMNRAGEESRRVLCILSPNYLEEDSMAEFESQDARWSDPSGRKSRLIPLVLRDCALPNWINRLIPVDWTDGDSRQREWKRLLKVLGAAHLDTPPPNICSPQRLQRSTNAPAVTWIHDYLLPSNFVGRDEELSQIHGTFGPRDADSNPCFIFAITAIGGVGKSCLARMALERKELHANFTRVIWFSFYEARTEDDGYFFEEMLSAIGPSVETEASGTKRTARLRKALCKGIDSERLLIILDGLEVIQSTGDPEAPSYGKITNGYKEVMRFLKHALNQRVSTLLITTRVPLRDFEGAAGYRALPLKTLPIKPAANFLRRMGVVGSEQQLEECAELFGGHPLSLRAAGEYMSRRRLPAHRVEELTGNGEFFKASSEGEKVRRIVDQYRGELTAAQEHFLKMLSLHPRSVSPANFPVLIAGFNSVNSDDRKLDAEIIAPLSGMGLIDIHETANGALTYSAHPLMKLAYSSWLHDAEKVKGHKVWAHAAEVVPVTYGANQCSSLAELQPFVDATNQYLHAGEIGKAWAIFNNRGTGERLERLGYFAQCFHIAEKFELAVDREPGSLDAKGRMALFERLAQVTRRLGKGREAVGYRRKQLEFSKETGFIDNAEDLLVHELLMMGLVKEAEQHRRHSKDTKALVELYKGHYLRAAIAFAKLYPARSGHSKTVCGARLGQALYRDGQTDEAENVLIEALELSRRNHFTCCELPLIASLMALEIKRGNVDKAREYQDTFASLRESVGLDGRDSGFLLVAEGEWELALDNIKNENEDDDDPESRISNALLRCAASVAQRQKQTAFDSLKQAEALMKASGCHRLRDVFDDLDTKIRSL